MLFLVRDWPNAFETGYGWNGGRKLIDEILAEQSDQNQENRELRKHIKSCFDEIMAFLLPYPGTTVAQGEHFNGNLQQIDEQFIKHIKDLVPAIFAPEKLIAKKTNGQKWRARDFIQYIQTYTSIYNGNTLPEPQTIFIVRFKRYL